jgi:uncharacterized protein
MSAWDKKCSSPVRGNLQGCSLHGDGAICLRTALAAADLNINKCYISLTAKYGTGQSEDQDAKSLVDVAADVR